MKDLRCLSTLKSSQRVELKDFHTTYIMIKVKHYFIDLLGKTESDVKTGGLLDQDPNVHMTQTWEESTCD